MKELCKYYRNNNKKKIKQQQQENIRKFNNYRNKNVLEILIIEYKKYYNCKISKDENRNFMTEATERRRPLLSLSIFSAQAQHDGPGDCCRRARERVRIISKRNLN